MKNWQQVEIPLKMKNLEKDPRGLPVPYVVFKDTKGNHHFKINDSHKSQICIVRNLCSICGTFLDSNDKWLVGGIASAFDPGGYYIDLPVHKECGTYALQVCPYLAISNYNGKLDLQKLQNQLPETILQNLTVDSDRLPFFVFVRPLGISFFRDLSQNTMVKPTKPYFEVEFWNDGEIITDLGVIKLKLYNTKWEKYLDEIIKLPQYVT